MPLETGLVRGPSKIEHAGSSLTVDLGPADSPLAVSRENRMPRASWVVTTVAREIIRISKAGEKLDSVVVWGSQADPTMHPDFREVVGNLRDLRTKWFPKSQLCLVAEAPRLDDPSLRIALGIYSRVYLRFEWGLAKTYGQQPGRKSSDLANLQALVENLDSLCLVAQFRRGEDDNSSPAEVRAWIKRVGELRPREVLLLEGSGKAARGKGKPVPKARLQEIADEVKEKLGLTVQILPVDALVG